MSRVDRIGRGMCPECGEETLWLNGKHLCDSCGAVRGTFDGQKFEEKEEVIEE